MRCELDMSRYRHTNADSTVHLRRPPIGDWVGLSSRTLLLDEKSVIGRAAQTLFVTPAPAPAG